MYNSTTKYDFVIIYLQILIKTAKIDQRVTTTGRSFRNDTMDRWKGNRQEMMARYEAKDSNKKEDDDDTTKQQQHKKKEKTTKQKQPDGEFKDFEKFAAHDNRHNNKK